jgi:hypothetical protein
MHPSVLQSPWNMLLEAENSFTHPCASLRARRDRALCGVVSGAWWKVMYSRLHAAGSVKRAKFLRRTPSPSSAFLRPEKREMQCDDMLGPRG